MAISKRGLGVTVGAVLSALVVTASVSWACSVQARTSMQNGQTSGPSGSRVTVEGYDFGDGVTEIRWNSATGMLLGQATGSNFSVAVTIPQAAPGVHYILAKTATGARSASAAFEVTAAPQPSTAPEASPTAGRTSNAATGTDEETTEQGVAEPQRSTGNRTTSDTDTSNATDTGDTGTTTGRADTAAAEDRPAVAAPAQATTSPVSEAGAARPAEVGAKKQPASANPAAVVAPSGQAVFGASVGVPAPSDSVSGPQASAATVSGDTWSGFATSTKPSLLDAGTVGSATSGGSPSAPALGVGLLGAGMVALLSGFGLAELRRKRVLAGGTSGSSER